MVFVLYLWFLDDICSRRICFIIYLATIIELTGYILLYTLVDNEDIFMEIYKDKSPQKLVEEKKY